MTLTYYVEYIHASSVLDYFKGSIPPDLPYNDKMLNTKPTKIKWTLFYLKPKVVGEWEDFGRDASQYLATGKLQSSLAYLDYEIDNVVESEADLRPYVEQNIFRPLRRLGSHTRVRYAAERTARKKKDRTNLEKSREGEVKREKPDYMLEFCNKGKCPFELKTKATMKAQKAFDNAPVQLVKLNEDPEDDCKCLGQIYKCMVNTNSQCGILSCYDTTIFLRTVKIKGRYVRLGISRPVANRSDKPYLHQAFVYFGSLVQKNKQKFPYNTCKCPFLSCSFCHNTGV